MIFILSCSKNCRDLLSNVSHRHPFHISTLLRVLADRVQHVGKLASYLFRELPFAVWRPTKVRSSIGKSAKTTYVILIGQCAHLFLRLTWAW